MTKDEFLRCADAAAYMDNPSLLRPHVDALFADLEKLRERVSTQDDGLRYGEQVCARLIKERDEAQEQARLGKMIASRMQAERDEARAEVERLRASPPRW